MFDLHMDILSVILGSFVPFRAFNFLICGLWGFLWKGGGPYGAEVTRGQDLTGKDFSGKTLINQDFKTVHLS